MATMQVDALDALCLINSEGLYAKLGGAEDPLVLRKKASEFRKGYKNWRQKKARGARGETNYLLNEKVYASEMQDGQQEVLKQAAEEVALIEEELASTPVGLGISKSNSYGALAAALPPTPLSISRRPSFSNEDVELPLHDDNENWLKFYVNPFSGMAEANLTAPLQLKQANLALLPSSVLKPQYDRPQDVDFVDHYMCHLGVGGFHRSHQCVYTDDLLNLGTSTSAKWGIVGVGLMDWDRKMYETLKGQDNLFTLLSRAPAVQEARVIGSIVDFVFAPADHQGCIDKLADPKTKIVSLTVTEKGYCQNVSGDLDTENAFVKSDLEGDLACPKTAIGMICAALRARKNRGIESFTVMSCDNLPENGDKIKHVVLQMAKYVCRELHAWVSTHTTFPNTMVDRITPVTEEEHIDIVARDYYIKDGWPVIAEDFKQWVVEDNFVCGHPPWDKVGALIVEDVKPYEFMKLRLLNGGHSALSYISSLCGYAYVDDAMADPLISDFVMSYFNEMKCTLLPIPGVDTEDYMQKLIDRFSNPYIKDRCDRLAVDGSKKMQNTMRDGVVELTAKGLPTTIIALANAAWIRYMVGYDEEGNSIVLNDPVKDELCELAKEAISEPEKPAPERFLHFIHGPQLMECAGFVEQVKQHLISLLSLGARATLESLVSDGPVQHVTPQ